ncbi:MAG TPA: hypothetical protein VMT53_11785 [Terriglobales bacterium]|nr:hypothetical protein [Terriglobales bacterium]
MFKHCNADTSSTPSATLATPSRANTEEVDARDVLAELYELLEMYSPAWYTEEHHRRAKLALQGPDSTRQQRKKAH